MKHQALFSLEGKNKKNKCVVCCNFDPVGCMRIPAIFSCHFSKGASFCDLLFAFLEEPSRVAQLVGHLTRKSIPGRQNLS